MSLRAFLAFFALMVAAFAVYYVFIKWPHNARAAMTQEARSDALPA
jgi:multidrug resistance efflux pump